MKVNFLLNSVGDLHAIKRIEDFKAWGANVSVYGFKRENESKAYPDAIIVGSFPNSLRYKKRIAIYYHGVRTAIQKEKDNDAIWFYLGLDVAMFAFFINRKAKYIYEECDLVHTYVSNHIIYRILEKVDRCIIKHSYKSLLTSDGYLDFHYGKVNQYPSNIIIVPNKLTSRIKNFGYIDRETNKNHLRFAFVGVIRYLFFLNIANSISKNFGNHEFHFYGFMSQIMNESQLPKADNIFYHGSYVSPDDLPKIYENVDVLICTYDVNSLNIRYAEPNKLYEAIYFSCPIIVSKNTFLAEKVENMNIGYSIDPNNESEVIAMVKQIETTYDTIVENLTQMNRDSAIDDISYVDSLLMERD